MTFQTLTLFPDLFENWLHQGLVGRALEKRVFSYETMSPRKYAAGIHKSVDDKVYGGGDGMAQSYSPWSQALESIRKEDPKTKFVFLTPQGKTWNQSMAREWLETESHLTFVCGRYAGFDERLIVKYADFEVSVGDYVLNGGELPAMIIMETLLRGLPDVLGHEDSFSEDSFGKHGLLECPTFTRPQEIAGLKVPQFLIQGHHEQIEAYRRAVSIVRTHLRRPDLILSAGITESEIRQAYSKVSDLPDEERELLGVKI